MWTVILVFFIIMYFYFLFKSTKGKVADENDEASQATEGRIIEALKDFYESVGLDGLLDCRNLNETAEMGFGILHCIPEIRNKFHAKIDRNEIGSDEKMRLILYFEDVKHGSEFALYRMYLISRPEHEMDNATILLKRLSEMSVNGCDTNEKLKNIVDDGLLDVAKICLDNGAIPDLCTADSGVKGLTPLFVSMRSKFDDFSCLLLDHGASAVNKSNAIIPSGLLKVTPLMQAVFLDASNKVVSKILDSGGFLNNLEHVNDDVVATPLGVAIDRGNVRLARLLIEKGADVNQPAFTSCDNSPYNPLYAALIGRDEAKTLVPILLQRGAKVPSHDVQFCFSSLRFDELSLQIAKNNPDFGSLTFLDAYGNEPLFHVAVSRDATKTVEFLLNKGYNPNNGVISESTSSPFFPISCARSKVMLDLLISNGASVCLASSKSNDPYYSLKLAARAGHDVLLRSEINVWKQSTEMLSDEILIELLWLSALAASDECIRIIISEGVPKKIADDEPYEEFLASAKSRLRTHGFYFVKNTR